jgi:P-type Ca2+ transporter type 2C
MSVQDVFFCGVVHTVGGRIRLRLGAAPLSREAASAIERFLCSEPGVRSVRLNPGCNSIVVQVDPLVVDGDRLAPRLSQFAAAHFRRRDWRVDGFEFPEPELLLSGRGSDSASAIAAAARAFRQVHEVVSAPEPLVLQRTQASSDRPQNGSAKRRRLPALVREEVTAPPWRQWDAKRVLEHWETDARGGLSNRVAAWRIAEFGPNTLQRIEPRSPWTILLGQIVSLPVAMLLGSAVLSAVTGGVIDAVAILGVVVINAGIGYVTESRSEETIAALANIEQPTVRVVREGREREIAVDDVVPGDLLVLSPGEIVAADARLIESDRLTADESSLTGESMPVAKTVLPLHASRAPLRDWTNMLFRGTVVTGGAGRAVVVATGRDTEIGKIQRLVGDAHAPETPMQRQLAQLGTILGLASGAVCGGVFAIGLARGYGVLEMLKSTVSLAVAAVPEGLPVLATTTLALGVGRMQNMRVLVRRLEAVETLGSVQVFCFDKTGTITENRMRVAKLSVGGETLNADLETLAAGNGKPAPLERRDVRVFLQVGALCNEVKIDGGQRPDRLVGSPTETALVRLAIQSEMDVASLRRDYPLEEMEHRTEERALMATLHARSDRLGKLLAVKGQPGQVLKRCRWRLAGEKRLELTEDDREQIRAENDRMAGEALRVLALAYRDVDEGYGAASADGNLTWLGLAGIADPIRPGVKEVIAQFHRAGIRTLMITGDQNATASAIARELNVSGGERLNSLDSSELDEINPEVLKGLVRNVHVFSSVSPSHKLQIVQALQNAGLVVAMTGDGINDGLP